MKFNEFNNGDTNTMKTMTSKEKKQAFLDACMAVSYTHLRAHET